MACPTAAPSRDGRARKRSCWRGGSRRRSSCSAIAAHSPRSAASPAFARRRKTSSRRSATSTRSPSRCAPACWTRRALPPRSSSPSASCTTSSRSSRSSPASRASQATRVDADLSFGMDPRSAAHVLTQIAQHLELRGESSFKSRAYEQAATALLGLDTDDLAPVYRDGTLAATRGLGPATLSVVRDLIETGESSYLEQLRATTPSGLLDLLRIPGLSTAKIHKLHDELGVDSIESLEAAARDGRIAKLPRYGPKTAEKILKGIEFLRASGSLQ